MAVGVFSLLQLGPRIQNWDPILGIGTPRLAGAGNPALLVEWSQFVFTSRQPPPARNNMRVNKESRWRCWKVLRSEPRYRANAVNQHP